jgi:hypothetical protein
MAESVLAEVELRAYVTVLMVAPADRSRDVRDFASHGVVVAVTDFFIDDVVDHASLHRPRWSQALAASIARHDDLFHSLFG